ncbi:hypothetical protein NQ317_015918 [Molorchus minor]|uniref:Retrotransposon gag domain-containing protein n=1 Tax=Molorchus minor TaxID=1323400 RepID=A0ABQ9JIR5_9CUCU|nr:hypothetical protein NQ317_015918 [Molorchus minor]
MSRKIKVNRLAQDELTYELTVRGIGTGTCDQMRASLSRAFQMEKDGTSVKRPSYPYTHEQDVTAVTTKLDDFTIGVQAFDDGKSSNQYVRWETKLNHILGRVELMQTQDGDEAQLNKKSELMARIFDLMNKLDDRAKRHESQNVTPAEISMLSLRIDESSASDSDEDIRPNDTSGTSEAEPTRRVIKSTPVAKWDLHFLERKEGCLSTLFCNGLKEMRIRGMSPKWNFETAVDLFQGPALIWYRAVRREVGNWDALVRLLREEFQPVDYMKSSLKRLRRTGKDESIGIYLSIMSAMFDRLTCPVSESVQLKIIREIWLILPNSTRPSGHYVNSTITYFRTKTRGTS